MLKVMEIYWLQRPQLGRIVLMAVFSAVALTLSLISSWAHEPRRYWLQSSTYVLLILNILVGEVTISFWRHKRDQAIKELSQEGI